MTNKEIIIGPCLESDLPHIGRLYREFVAFHSALDPCFMKVGNHDEFFENFIRENLGNTTSKVLVARRKDLVIGYCLGVIMEKPPVYADPRHGYIDNICVTEEYQRKGIGERLFREMMEWFSNQGIARIELFAAIRNGRSTRFWRKMGFAPYCEQMALPLSEVLPK